MKILRIHNRYIETGGEDEVVRSDTQMLRDKGHEVIIYERSNQEINRFSISRRLTFFLKDIIWSNDSYKQVKKLAREAKPDIAHIDNIFLMITPSVYDALKELKIPILQSLCSYRLICPKGMFYRDKQVCELCREGDYSPAVRYRCLRSSLMASLLWARMLKAHYRNKTFFTKPDAFITLSDFSKEIFVKWGIDRKKIFVKPVAVAEQPRLNHTQEDYALYIGRFVDYKGVKTLVSAFEKLPEYNLKLIGDGPLYPEIKEKARRMKNIELLGSLSSQEKFDYIRRSRFVIFPSECFETFGIVMLEAYSCRVSVIGSDLGTRKELVKNMQTGLLFRPADVNDLAAKISWAFEHPQKMREFGEKGRDLHSSSYSPDKNYQLLIDIYREILKDKPA
ncbi:MAG: glycosyltransferase family 4 protein [Candidatus Omnitrophica bacterium]|nr:glycosyltransferase family 4 protein [Candidatus Omnitrophota bacterium]